jgi:serine/threonine-protein kinase
VSGAEDLSTTTEFDVDDTAETPLPHPYVDIDVDDSAETPVPHMGGPPSSTSGVSIESIDVSDVDAVQVVDDWDAPDEAEPAPKSLDGDPYIGTTIGDRYVVDDVLGEGGMGKVYLVHHKVIDKQLAIKILHAELAKDKEAVGRFVREAKSASSIGNQHIVDISDFGETSDGSTYFVMEYLGGETLADLIDDGGALPVEKICDISLQMCDGLAAAHRKQIIHRDLKPDNVTLTKQGNRENFVKILDFGIAKVGAAKSSTKLTMAGAVFGTPHYMSPEQAAGAQVDYRTDIYSLGVMMYEMVSGELPFNADNFMGILTQHMYKAPVPIRALVSAPDCPAGLEAVILKCLSKKPDGRYQTMDELADDIRRFQAGEIPEAVQEMMDRSGGFNVPADYFQTSSAPAVVPADPMTRPQRRSGPRIVLFAALAVAIGAVLFVVMRDSVTSAGPKVGETSTEQPSTSGNEATATVEHTADPADVPVQVKLQTEPRVPGAYTTIAGKRIDLPDFVEVRKGQPLQVEVQADGYKPATVTRDGTAKSAKVELKKAGRTYRPPIRRRPPTGKKPPKSSSGSGEVVDPWGGG